MKRLLLAGLLGATLGHATITAVQTWTTAGMGGMLPGYTTGLTEAFVWTDAPAVRVTFETAAGLVTVEAQARGGYALAWVPIDGARVIGVSEIVLDSSQAL